MTTDLTGVYPGTIKTAPGAPGDAANLSYTVIAHLPSGAVTFPNAKPAQLRPDSAIDTKPARSNDPCLVLVIGKQVYFLIFELQDTGECQP